MGGPLSPLLISGLAVARLCIVWRPCWIAWRHFGWTACLYVTIICYSSKAGLRLYHFTWRCRSLVLGIPSCCKSKLHPHKKAREFSATRRVETLEYKPVGSPSFLVMHRVFKNVIVPSPPLPASQVVRSLLCCMYRLGQSSWVTLCVCLCAYVYRKLSGMWNCPAFNNKAEVQERTCGAVLTSCCN